jgi:hypothetical protein
MGAPPDSTYSRSIPTPLRLERWLLGLTLWDVGQAIGSSEAVLSRLERGRLQNAFLEKKVRKYLAEQRKAQAR